MKTMIDTVIFDLGGVLIEWDPLVPYREAFDGDEKKAKWFIDNICDYEWNLQMDAGKPFSQAIAEKIEEFPEYEKYIRLYWEKWRDTLVGSYSHTVQVLTNLHDASQYRLFAITNWSAETFPYAKQKFPFLNWFEGVAVSGVLKMRKPYREIFDYATTEFDLIPGKIRFYR